MQVGPSGGGKSTVVSHLDAACEKVESTSRIELRNVNAMPLIAAGELDTKILRPSGMGTGKTAKLPCMLESC